MAPRKGSLRARASSILRSPLATIHQGQLHNLSEEKRPHHGSKFPTNASLHEKQNGMDRSQNAGAYKYGSSGENASAHDRDAQRIVRTIPTWVCVPDEDAVGLASQSRELLSPAGAYVAHHNSLPSGKRKFAQSPQPVHDQDSDWNPPWPGATPSDSCSRWRAFATATAYPRLYPDGGQIVGEEWFRQNGPNYYEPWLAGHQEGNAEDGAASLFKSRIQRRAWHSRVQRTILLSPVVPMVIRMIVFGFSVVALGLGCSLHHITKLPDNVAQPTPSTNMAIIVDAIALVYLLYITYDEYSGKPLGLRPAKAKMRLIFLDLFFIVFDSANLSLAFEATRSNNNCDADTRIEQCNAKQDQLFNAVFIRQKALASVLLIALIAWLSTFAISVARCVEEVSMPNQLLRIC